MKKKLLSVLLALVFTLPCMFSLAACKGDGESEELTNAQMSTIYKDVAVETWSKLGVSDPTTPAQASAMSVTIPDKKVETSDANSVLNIKMNANSMAGLMYMLSLLYQNENHVVLLLESKHVQIG